MRQVDFDVDLGLLVSATSGCAIPDVLGRPAPPGAGSDLHIREPASDAGRMGAILAARPARPHDALSAPMAA